MNARARLERRIDMLEEQIDDMERNYDGSIQWVDDIRELYRQLWEAQEELAELGGYREANERR